MRSFTIDAARARMRYLEFAGADPPLLMIHGLGCASSFEYPPVALAPALRGRLCILIDLPGFGFSDHPEDFGYRVPDHAALLARFVRDRCVGPIDLYGHSMGGTVAIEAADLLGGRVRNLVLSEANLDPGGGEFSRPIAASGEARYVESGHGETIARALAGGDDVWAATMRVASARAVYRGAQSLVDGGSPDWRGRFLRHPARRCFIFGARSLPDPDAGFLAAHGIGVLVVADAGHSMSLENPHGLAAAIAEATT